MPALTRFDAENCAVVFLDHTPSLFPVASIEAEKLENGVLGLAKVARELGMPVVISTMQPKEAALADPLFGKLTRVLAGSASARTRPRSIAWFRAERPQ